MSRIWACLKLIRAVNSAMVGFAVIVGVVLALGGTPGNLSPIVLISAFLVGFSISGSSMILNDIIDIEIDKINAPNRPLPSGAISIRAAKACFTVLVAIGLAASLVTGLDSLLVAAAGAGASVLYNAKLKLKGFPGNIAVAFLTSLPFLYAFTVVDSPNPTVLVFWAMVFLSVLGREIAKDIADVEGDAVKGARTVPIVLGRRTAAVLSGFFYISAVGLSPLPLILKIVKRPLVYASGVSVVDAVLIISTIILIASPRRAIALKHKNYVLFAMLLGLIVFLAAQI